MYTVEQLEAYEERAAIMEYDGGLSIEDAERRASLACLYGVEPMWSYPSTSPRAITPVAPALTATSVHIMRELIPSIAEAVDALRAVFGEVEVIYSEEGGKSIGKQPGAGVIPRPLINLIRAPKGEKASAARRRLV